MAESTAIEWTDATWSPWEGCQKVSPGCDHCYAERMNGWLRGGENWGPGAPRRVYSDEHWAKPLRWAAASAKKRQRIRVFPSVCDPFDPDAPEGQRERFWQTIYGTADGVDWLLLTKRIGNVKRMVPEHWLRPGVWPAHVWLGATVVNQEEADRDIPKLLATPARVRFLSMEPLLGPVDLRLMQRAYGFPRHITQDGRCVGMPQGLHWVIAGGESGPKARPSHPDWFRSLRDQCAAAGVPFLFKQWGEWAPDDGSGGAEGITRALKAAIRGTVRTNPGDDLYRYGKKAAGRQLDGREHNEFPTP